MMKRYLTGSSLFFKSYPDFEPHDIDYCELHDSLDVMYKKDEDADFDVYQWRRATPEEYVAFALKEATPWQICQFLTPGFCKEVGFTVEHLKLLRPLTANLNKKHLYEKIIFDAFILNNGYFLTKEQLDKAYEEYKDKRKYDYFFNKD